MESPRILVNSCPGGCHLPIVRRSHHGRCLASTSNLWDFVYAANHGTADDRAAYGRILSTPAAANQTWAAAEPLIGIAISRNHFAQDGEFDRWHAYDTGGAMAVLTVQAEAEGLKVHQMATSTRRAKGSSQPARRLRSTGRLCGWIRRRCGAPVGRTS